MPGSIRSYAADFDGDGRIDLVKLPDELALDRTFLRHCLLTMYANPVRSMLQARQGSIANSGA